MYYINTLQYDNIRKLNKLGRYQSGQMEQTVNLSASVFGGFESLSSH